MSVYKLVADIEKVAAYLTAAALESTRPGERTIGVMTLADRAAKLATEIKQAACWEGDRGELVAILRPLAREIGGTVDDNPYFGLGVRFSRGDIHRTVHVLKQA